jgi:hypothetical protein
MAQQHDRLSRIIKLAYQLARTGRFEDIAAVERRIVALGYEEEAASLESPGVRVMIDEICATRRDSSGPGWHRHSAC